MSPHHRKVETEVRIVRPEDGISVVFLIGEHDLATQDEISDAINAALDVGEGVVADLSSADFIDSSVLHVLVAAARRAAESGRGFSLVIGDNQIVRQVLELTSLLSQFEPLPSVEAAVAELRTFRSKARIEEQRG